MRSDLIILLHCSCFLLTKAFRPRPQQRLFSIPTTSSSSSTSLPMAEARMAASWLKTESIQNLLPKEDCKAILNEFRSEESELLSDDNRQKYDKYFVELENKVRAEGRTLAEILGPGSTEDVLKSIEKVDVYDPEAVQAFLNTPAVDKMIAGVLYEGIFEFIQAVDIIGNVVNKLPVIGPVRKVIVVEFKKNLQNALGPQVQSFLRSFNRVAIGMMIDFVLSEENKRAFSQSNRKLVQSILDRPANSLLPSDSTIRDIKDSAWKAIKETPLDDQLVDSLYESLQKINFEEDLPIDEILNASPTLERVLDQSLSRYHGHIAT